MCFLQFAILLIMAFNAVLMQLAILSGAEVRMGKVRMLDTSGSDDGDCVVLACKTLQHALLHADHGDDIVFNAGIFKGEGNRNITVEKIVNVIGAGREMTVLDMEGKAIGLKFDLKLTVQL